MHSWSFNKSYKKYSSNQQFVEIGTHPDPFISDDVCCYSQPRFDKATKLFHNLGGRLHALIMVHFRSPSMNVFGFVYLA